MDFSEYKPLYSQECKINYTIDCESGDNGVSFWCGAVQDDLARALSKEGVPRAFSINVTLSQGDVGVSASKISSELIGILIPRG